MRVTLADHEIRAKKSHTEKSGNPENGTPIYIL